MHCRGAAGAVWYRKPMKGLLHRASFVAILAAAVLPAAWISAYRTVAQEPSGKAGQELVANLAAGRVVIAGQCVYKFDETLERRVASDNMHDASFIEAGQQSLDRLLGLDPRYFVAAHDARPSITG